MVILYDVFGLHGFCNSISMKMSIAIIPALLLLLAGTSCTNVKEPEFRRLENFGVRKASLKAATVGFDVTYYNPNNFNVSVKEAAADIFVDSVYLGKFVQERNVDVEKGAEFSIPFAGSVQLGKLLQLDLKDINSREVVLRADGSARIGKAGIYITKPIKYSGRHRLDEIKF